MTDCDSCGGSPLDASKDQTEGESQLDSLLDEIDEINGANDRDGATDQDVVQICAQQQQIAPQTERFRKKAKRHSKELREKTPNPGSGVFLLRRCTRKFF
jgi:hypothetical protein